jgi:hypothetical protein
MGCGGKVDMGGTCGCGEWELHVFLPYGHRKLIPCSYIALIEHFLNYVHYHITFFVFRFRK